MKDKQETDIEAQQAANLIHIMMESSDGSDKIKEIDTNQVVKGDGDILDHAMYEMLLHLILHKGCIQ